MAETILVERDGADRDRRAQPAREAERAHAPDVEATRRGVRASSPRTTRVRCIVIRGAGTKAVRARQRHLGVRDRALQRRAGARATARTCAAPIEAIGNCRHPVVAQIHGICVGGGLEIAGLADIRICGESSRFGVPINEARPGDGVRRDRLAHLARRAKPVALEILLEGPRVRRGGGERQGPRHARRARRPGGGGSAGDRAAHRRWRAARRALAQEVRAPAARSGKPLTAAEYDEGFDCFGTEDFQIGYKAFLAKQKPEFVGK